MDINEATDIFENNIITLVNEAQIPMVNIELVLGKVLSAVTNAKLRAIREARNKTHTDIVEDQHDIIENAEVDDERSEED